LESSLIKEVFFDFLRCACSLSPSEISIKKKAFFSSGRSHFSGSVEGTTWIAAKVKVGNDFQTWLGYDYNLKYYNIEAFFVDQKFVS